MNLNVISRQARSRGAFTLMLVTGLFVSGCKQSGSETGGLVQPAVQPVPAEIGDLCFSAYEGTKTASIFEAVYENLEPKSVVWEKTSKGYIWRAVKNVALEQRDITIALEFVVDPEAEQIYQLLKRYPTDCGPAALATLGGMLDGQPVDGRVITRDIFEVVLKPLREARNAREHAERQAIEQEEQSAESPVELDLPTTPAEAEYYANQSDDAAE